MAAVESPVGLAVPSTGQPGQLRASTIASKLNQTAHLEFYGEEAVTQATKHANLVFSYAAPHQLKQAKLEAMQLKIKERLSANIKPPPPDPYMGLETAWNPEDEQSGYSPFDNGESGRMRPGGLEQYQSLVIPPELGERGEEKISTAKLVVQGKVSDYERASKKGANSQAVNVGLAGDVPASAPSLTGKTGTKGTSENKGSSPSSGKGGAVIKKQRAGFVSPAKKERPPEDPLLKSLKSSVAVQYVPVLSSPGTVPAKGVSTIAQVVGAVRNAVDGLLVRPVAAHAPTSAKSRSVDSSGANKGLVRTSFAGGSDMGSTKGDASADGGGPLVMVEEEDLLEQYKRQSTAHMMAAAGMGKAVSLRRSASQRSTGSTLHRSASSHEGDSRRDATKHMHHSLAQGYSKHSQSAAKDAVLATSEAILDALAHALQANQAELAATEELSARVPGGGFRNEDRQQDVRRPDQHAGAAAKSSAGQRGADVQTPLREPPINPQDKEQPSCEQLGQPPREQALNPRQQAQPFTPPIAAGTSPLTARPSVTPSALPLPAMPPVAYGSPPQQAPFPSPRCLTEPGHPQPSPSSPRECASAFVQLPQYGAQACLSSAHPVSAKVWQYSQPIYPHASANVPGSGLYRWQSTGPRHREPSPSTYATLHHPVYIVPSSLSQADQGSASFSAQSLALRPTSGARRETVRPDSAPTGSLRQWAPSPSPGFRFSITGFGYGEAKAHIKPPEETTQPHRPKADVRIAQAAHLAAVPPTRKSTNRERNGLLAWATAWRPPSATTLALASSAFPSTPPAPAAPSNPPIDHVSVSGGPLSKASTPRPTSAAPNQHTTCTVAGLVAEAKAKRQVDMQYRVLEFAAQRHGLNTPDELLAQHMAPALSESLTLTPAATTALQLHPRVARPMTAPPARGTYTTSSQLRSSVQEPTGLLATGMRGSSTSVHRASTSGFNFKETRSGSAPTVRAAPSAASRPQSAVAFSAAGVPSARTRPPSAGVWGGGTPHQVTSNNLLMNDDECEMLWSFSVDLFSDTPGLANNSLVGYILPANC